MFRALRTRFAAIVLLAAVPGFVLAIFAANEEARTDRERVRTEAAFVVDAAADRYHGAVARTELLLETLGGVPSIVTAGAFCAPQLAAIVERDRTYHDVAVVGAAGDVLCSARGEAVAVGAEDWFAPARSGPAFQVHSTEGGNPLVATFVLGSTDATAPLLVAWITIAPIDAESLLGRLPERSSIVLLAPDDRVLARWPDDGSVGRVVTDAEIVREIRDEDGGGRTERVADGTDGVERIYAFTAVERPEGAVIYGGVPTDAAFHVASDRFWRRIVGLVLAFSVALGAALVVADLVVVRRVRALVDLARRLGRGELSARSEVSGNDEITVLAQALDAMGADIQEREREREHLVAAVVEAGEQERRRIASDVHDDSIQVMSAHVMALQLLRRRAPNAALLSQIDELEASGRAAIDRLRDLVFELHSPALEEGGLTPAVELLMARTFEGQDVTHAVEAMLEEPVPDAVRDTAYRIIQEAVSNVRRHAQARTVTVSLRRDADDLVVRVTDDGVGFDAAGLTPRPGHLGLAGATERAAALGGALAVESVPGAGTVVVCRLPWSVGDAVSP